MKKCSPLVMVVVVLALVSGSVVAQRGSQAQVLLEAARQKETLQGDLAGAIRQYQAIVDQFRKTDRATAAQALVALAECYRRLGDAQTRATYERVVKEFADQSDSVAKARARLATMNGAAPTSPPGIVAREVWTGDHTDAWTASPDGKLLPFVNHGRMTLRDLSTGEERALNPDAGYAEGAAIFTPDGRRMIYPWRDGATDDRLLKIVDVDGKNSRTFHRTRSSDADTADGIQWPWPYAISPDASLVAVWASDKGDRVIALINTTTSAVTILKRAHLNQIRVGGFSPDGRFLAYSFQPTRNSSDYEVRLAAVDGSSDTLLVGPRGQHRRPVFTPDGTRVVFASNRIGGRWDLWSVRVIGGQAQGEPDMVRADIGSVNCLGFSRDGTLYYSQTVSTENAFIVDVDPETGAAKGAPKRVSERFVHSSFGPIWSPDGGSLAYAAYASAAQQGGAGDVTIVVRSLDTGKEREFTASYLNTSSARYNQWYPDGKSLLLTDGDSTARVFRRLDLQSGQVSRVFEAVPNGAFRTHIEPDGRALYYRRTEPVPSTEAPGRTLTRWMRHDIETGEEHSVFETFAVAVNPSPDGKYLATIDTNTGPLELVAPGDKQAPRRLWAPTGMSFQGGGAGWAPQSRGIYVGMLRLPSIQTLPDAPDDPLEVWYVPLRGGEPHRIGVSMHFLNSLSVHPGGTQLGFSGNTTTGHVWSLKGLFPPPARVTSPGRQTRRVGNVQPAAVKK